MDYSKLSDQEIAAKVLIAQGYRFIGDSNGYSIYHSNAARKDIGPKALKCFAFNPCNNAADAWPIIVGNAIGVMPFKKGEAEAWSLSAGLLSNTTVKDKNPLRAAMIVYLMMQEGE